MATSSAAKSTATAQLAPEVFAERAARIENEVGRVIVGQRELIRQTMTCLLANGHALLEGVPGVAKTLLANATARALGMSFRRVQFTPDMLPSDLTGTMTLQWSPASRVQELVFRAGPVPSAGASM